VDLVLTEQGDLVSTPFFDVHTFGTRSVSRSDRIVAPVESTMSWVHLDHVPWPQMNLHAPDALLVRRSVKPAKTQWYKKLIYSESQTLALLSLIKWKYTYWHLKKNEMNVNAKRNNKKHTCTSLICPPAFFFFFLSVLGFTIFFCVLNFSEQPMKLISHVSQVDLGVLREFKYCYK
jgi:hypothetical protein